MMDQQQKEYISEKIIQEELDFQFAKSGWHGGQNVNKRETKAELFFNIDQSRYLDDDSKQRLKDLWGNFVHHEGTTLILTCQEERYQHANKEKVIHHFVQLLYEALEEPKERVATKLPKNKKQQRQKNKQHHSKKKHWRKAIVDQES